MILFHKDFNINYNDINFKQSRQCSKDFTFVPIQYNKKDFVIQTPHCFIPFGLKKYSTTSTKTYLDITFQEKHDGFIHNCFSIFYQRVLDKYANQYQIEPFVKESQSSKWMRFKVSEDCLLFDQNKNQIDSFNPKVFGIFIIQLTGLWIMNQKIWFNWVILQAKINLPIRLKEYAFVDDDEEQKKKIPIPPPPPPPPPPPLKKNNLIKGKDLQNIVLKKTKKIVSKKDSYMPSLDEIRNALQSLQRI